MQRVKSGVDFALQHFNVFSAGRHHGAATLFFFVGAVITVVYTSFEQFSDEQAYLLVVRNTEQVGVELVCGATKYCRFHNSNSNESLELTAGNATYIRATDPTWTVEALTHTSFTSKRVVLAVRTANDLIYFPAVEQETLRFITLSKTIDRTDVPELESWTVSDLNTYEEFPSCRSAQPPYDGADSHTCGAFQISFDRRSYIESARPDINLVLTVLSSAMAWITLYAWLYYLTAGVDLVLRMEGDLRKAEKRSV